MHITKFKIGDKIRHTVPTKHGDHSFSNSQGCTFGGISNGFYAPQVIYICSYYSGGKNVVTEINFQEWENDWELVEDKKPAPVQIQCVLIEKSEYDKLASRSIMADTMEKVIEQQDARIAKINEALKN